MNLTPKRAYKVTYMLGGKRETQVLVFSSRPYIDSKLMVFEHPNPFQNALATKIKTITPETLTAQQQREVKYRGREKRIPDYVKFEFSYSSKTVKMLTIPCVNILEATPYENDVDYPGKST